MKFVILLPLLVAFVSGEGAPYRFSYEANDEGQHTRNERGDHGSVQGSYSYVDPNGNLRQVNYVADEFGFRPSGDIGVDKETEAAAADLAAQAPQGNINFEAPGASYGSSSSSKGGYAKKSSYSAPRPRPQKSYQSPRQSYGGGGSKGGEYSQQQQQQSDFSYNTEISHQTPQRSSYNARPQKPRPQKARQQYQQPQYQQQQQSEDDGSYSGNDDSESYGPKKTVEYEVRAPTHKISARYN